MTTRNFDNRVIIQRLQDQNRARNLYSNMYYGHRIINNPQTSDPSSARLNTYPNGSQTWYFRSVEGGVTSSIGGIINIPPQERILPSVTPFGGSWLTTVKGASTENSRGLSADSNLNLYATGFFTDSALFSNYSTISSGVFVEAPFGTLPGAGLQDIYLVKYNSTGQTVWATTMGGSFTGDQGSDVATDSSNNVYFVGTYASTCFVSVFSTVSSGIIVTSTVGNFPIQTTSNRNALLMKFDSNGNYIWGTEITGPPDTNSQAFGVKVDNMGNIYQVGSFNQSCMINSASTISSGIIITSTFAELQTGFSSDGFVAKYNPSGQALWAIPVSGSGTGLTRSVATDTVGNVYITGTTISQFNSSFNYVAVSSNVVSTSLFGVIDLRTGGFHSYVSKINSNGTVQWINGTTGPGSEQGWGVATDNQNNVYNSGFFTNSTIVGYFSTISSGFAVNSTFGVLVSDPRGTLSTNWFLTKYDTNGVPLWATNIGGINNEGRTLATDISNNVYVAGYTGGVSSIIKEFSTVSSNIIVTSTVGIVVGQVNQDALVVKYSSTGKFIWANNIGLSGNDQVVSLTTDSSENVYLSLICSAGLTVNTFSTISSGIIVLSTIGTVNTTGSTDGVVVKFDSNGQFLF